VLLLAGNADPVVAPANSSALAARLREAGAEVTLENVPAGHGLTQIDVALTREWLVRL
jgi:phospholipase/carboxylesterase